MSLLPAMSLPALIVLHGELSTPGRVGLGLRSRGIELDIRRPRFVPRSILLAQLDTRQRERANQP